MIKGNMDNNNAIPNLLGYLDNQERDLNVRLTKEILALNMLVKAKLNETLGEKAKHFSVNISPSGIGVEIVVRTNDSVGNFIYRGTSAHDIISTTQAMPMPDGGFSRAVRHPGTEPMKDQIDQAIASALVAARFM
jgi:hypothetical protein